SKEAESGDETARERHRRALAARGCSRGFRAHVSRRRDVECTSPRWASLCRRLTREIVPLTRERYIRHSRQTDRIRVERAEEAEGNRGGWSKGEKAGPASGAARLGHQL